MTLVFFTGKFIYKNKEKIKKNESSLINEEINFLKDSLKESSTGCHSDLFPDNIFYK